MDTSSVAINAATDLARRRQLSGEVAAKLAAFCRTLALPPEALNLDDGSLAMLVSMRLFETVTLKLKELDARIAILESYKALQQ